MSYRKPTKKRVDKKKFTKNAQQIKKINLEAKPQRGGIRL